MNKLIGGVEGLPWAGSWMDLWRSSVCPKPDVSLLNQHVSLEIYSRTESTHKHPRTDTRSHTNIKEDILSAAKCASIFIYTDGCQNAKAPTKQILAQKHKRKQKFILFTHPCAYTNTRLAQRFTTFWKDKHQPMNKFASLEICWPPSLPFFVTHTSTEVKVRQGWAEGQREVKVYLCVGTESKLPFLDGD